MGDPARGTGEKGAPVQRGPAPQSTAEMREVGGLERKACKPLPLYVSTKLSTEDVSLVLLI